MEKFTTFEKAMAYLDCANHYFDAVLTLNIDTRVMREIIRDEYIWTCDQIAALDYKKITEDEFNKIADAYDEFRTHYHEICE